jgi:uncharacterized repeat protein (TIGR01451 family)
MQLRIPNRFIGKTIPPCYAGLAEAAAVINLSTVIEASGVGSGDGAATVLPDLQVTAKVEWLFAQNGLPGGVTQYTFTIENKGKASATGVVFTAELPAEATLWIPVPGFAPQVFQFFPIGAGSYSELIDGATGQLAPPCNVSSFAGTPLTISCNLGQIADFLHPDRQALIGTMDPGVVNVVNFWTRAPRTPQFVAAKGTAVTDNGDSKVSNNTATVIIQVK